jgi:hypothetical protein
MANTAALTVATNLITSPGQAFAAIKERPAPWLPILLLLLVYVAVSFVYVNAVDLAWLIDQQLRAAGTLTDEQRTQAVDAALRLSPSVYGAIGVGSFAVIVLVVFALSALYYTGVSFFTKTGVKFKQWFALIAWCTLPVVIGLVATLVNLLASDVRFLPQESLNPLSFGNLLAIDNEGLPTLQRVLLQLDPTTIWSLVLTVLGYQAFTQRSTLHTAIVVLAPWFVIVLIGVLATL